MIEEASLEFQHRKIDETTNYLLHEIKHNDLISENLRKPASISIMLKLAYFSFNSYWLRLNFCICSISCYSCRYYDF